MHTHHIIHPATAANRGISHRQISACAAWNDEMAAAAYNAGLYDEANRLWSQGKALHATAAALRLAKAA